GRRPCHPFDRTDVARVRTIASIKRPDRPVPTSSDGCYRRSAGQAFSNQCEVSTLANARDLDAQAIGGRLSAAPCLKERIFLDVGDARHGLESAVSGKQKPVTGSPFGILDLDIRRAD